MPPERCHLLRHDNARLALLVLACLLLTAFVPAVHADNQPPAQQKITFSGELDLGVTYMNVSGAATDRPTQLKFGVAFQDESVGFRSRFLFFPPSPTLVTPQVDYVYGTYLLSWTLFDQLMTAKVSIGDFADLTDYVLFYNSNDFYGNPIGGYMEGLIGGELALSPIKNLVVATFIPWDKKGSITPYSSTIGNFDVNVSYTYPKTFKINAGYGNSYNGDIGGSLVQPDPGINLAYVNLSLLNLGDLTLGMEYGNYTNVLIWSPVMNYVTGTVNYAIYFEKSDDFLTFADDVFYFIGASGTNVIQEYFSVYYTFAHVFSGADLVFDMDINYANNNPQIDSTNANSLVATHKNVTLNPWVKIAYGTKRHFLALGYAYNYDLDASKTGYSEVILLATIYY